jgi:hypothetical protein
MEIAYLHVTAFAFNAAIARLFMRPAWHVGCTRITPISEDSVSKETSHVLVRAQILQPIFTSLPRLASSTPSMKDPLDLAP